MLFLILQTISRAGKVIQWVKKLWLNLMAMSLIPRIHMVQTEGQLLQGLIWPPHAHLAKFTYLCVFVVFIHFFSWLLTISSINMTGKIIWITKSLYVEPLLIGMKMFWWNVQAYITMGYMISKEKQLYFYWKYFKLQFILYKVFFCYC